MSLVLAIITLQTILSTVNGIRVACTPPNNSFLFCNTSLPITTRINNLISLLTLKEKVSLLTARKSPSITRLGIPEYNWGTNCIHSVLSGCYIDVNDNNKSFCPTDFPGINGIGATFNKSLVYNISVVIGLELRALWLKDLDVGLDCWGPTINIGRDPRWGRMYEVISEDPYWNGVYGTMFTLGLQNGSIDTPYFDSNYFLVISTLKHLAAYSLGGFQSFTFDAVVSDYLFMDTYFAPFIDTITNANAKGIMCSYNSINGIPACLDHNLLSKTLRQKWNFEGYITSDSGAIHAAYSGHHYTKTVKEAAKLAITASCDIDSGWVYNKYLEALVKDGDIDECFVDKALYNSLKIRFELGLFNPYHHNFNIPIDIVNSAKHNELSIFASHQVMTLLKNENNILPFDSRNKELTYAIIGPHCNSTRDLISDYAGGLCNNKHDHSCILSVISAMQKYVNSENILSSKGCNDVFCNETDGFQDAFQIAEKCDIIILMMGINNKIEREGIDRISISLPGNQQLLASTICALHKPTVLVLVNGGIVAIDELKYECPVILEAWYPGIHGAIAIVDTLFGINNPGGKMAVTMYWSNFTSMTDWKSMDITAPPFGRTYKYWNGPQPLYPFGWGLSYTIFNFSHYYDNECNETDIFCVIIMNTGNCSGYETIFVFIIPPGNTIPPSEPASKLIKRLVEFDKVYLDVEQQYIFKWKLNRNSHLLLYDKHGMGQLFGGNYTIQFTNGVEQNLFANVIVNQTETNNTMILIEQTETNNLLVSCNAQHRMHHGVINIIIIVFINVIIIIAVIVCFFRYFRLRNSRRKQKDIETELTRNMVLEEENTIDTIQESHQQKEIKDNTVHIA